MYQSKIICYSNIVLFNIDKEKCQWHEEVNEMDVVHGSCYIKAVSKVSFFYLQLYWDEYVWMFYMV